MRKMSSVPDELCNVLFYMPDKGDWPSTWAEGITHPVHKNTPITDHNRIITVKPAADKVLESIHNSILLYLEPLTTGTVSSFISGTQCRVLYMLDLNYEK